jgi:hypothetical protein
MLDRRNSGIAAQCWHLSVANTLGNQTVTPVVGQSVNRHCRQARGDDDDRGVVVLAAASLGALPMLRVKNTLELFR